LPALDSLIVMCLTSYVYGAHCTLMNDHCNTTRLRSMISPESWGFYRLSIVGTVCACGSIGPTLALTLCQHLTARVICGWRNIGTLVATCKTRANLWRRQSWHRCCNTCKTHANNGRIQSWHTCCYARIMPIVCKCWYRGRVLSCVNNCSSLWRTK